MERQRIKTFAQSVRWKNGAWRYRVPRWVSEAQRKQLFNGKQEITLAKNQADALIKYSEIIKSLSEEDQPIITMNDLMIRYLSEVTPTKAINTQKLDIISIKRLRTVFGEIPVIEFETPWVFKYKDKNKDRKKATNNDLAVLSHLFSKAIEWGIIKNEQHPMRGLNIKFSMKSRTRYVEHWELEEFLSVCSPFINAYVKLKLATGLRQGDLLRLTIDNLQDDGIYSVHQKTGKKTIYTWNEERREAIIACLKVRPCESKYIFCTRDGNSYSDGSQASGFASIWQRYMKKALNTTNLKERFTEHDLRAKVATDSDDIEQARKRLGHSSTSLTKKVYDRKAEIAD
ncbi:tyrosine-type recombinase/integrase [Entomomonas asaccharolytica]|uniref:Tyrosine-type recombinase/integrase n=1 Tax=Entomomonas asaccharolytica TaxID=2785331 RepID=A0A974NHE9_9GAMM|nr:tyrosine-type recombinase/integrase [Entomomonas asaccharolytica]QQP86895.1 tyrosine-type recombinase/integrase [Entomomonas asaccharolytica]